MVLFLRIFFISIFLAIGMAQTNIYAQTAVPVKAPGPATVTPTSAPRGNLIIRCTSDQYLEYACYLGDSCPAGWISSSQKTCGGGGGRATCCFNATSNANPDPVGWTNPPTSVPTVAVGLGTPTSTPNPTMMLPKATIIPPTATPFPKPAAVTVNKPQFSCNPISNLKDFEISWSNSPQAIAYNVKVGSSTYSWDQTGTIMSGVLQESTFPPNSQQTFTVEACNRGGCTPSSITVDIGASCGGNSTYGCPVNNGANVCVPAGRCPSTDRVNGQSGATACSAAHIGVGNNAVCCKANAVVGPTATPALLTPAPNIPTEPPQGNPPQATSVPPNTGNESASTGQPCNPARGHLACVSSSDVCEVGACGGAYFCVRAVGSANVKYCPGTGVIDNNASCAACPTEAAPSTPNPDLGASCGGSTACASPLVCTNTYSLSPGRYCCPSGQIYCDRVTTSGTPINGCMSHGQCKDAAGGVVCEKANGHCYGDDSKCCSNNCLGTGATAYCK